MGRGRPRRRRHVRGLVRRAPSPAAQRARRRAAAGTGRRGPPDRGRGADPHRARAARRGRPPGEPDDGAGRRGQGRGRRGPRGRPTGDGGGGGGRTPGTGRAAPPARGPAAGDRPRRAGPAARPRGPPPARRADPRGWPGRLAGDRWGAGRAPGPRGPVRVPHRPGGAHQRAQARRSRCPHRGAARHRPERHRHRGRRRRKRLGAAFGGGRFTPTGRIAGRRPAGSPVGPVGGARHRRDAGAARLLSGGTLEARPRPDGGFRVVAHLPTGGEPA